MKLLYIVWIAIFVYAMSSCTADKLPKPNLNQTLCDSVAVNYNEHIVSIFNSSCNYAGCHDGPSGLAPLVNYSDMDAARRELAYNRMLDGSMPPTYATGPTTLTQAQLDTIICWEGNGFSEN